MDKYKIFKVLILAMVVFTFGVGHSIAQPQRDITAFKKKLAKRITPAQRRAAAENFKAARAEAVRQAVRSGLPATANMPPHHGEVPHYFGPYPNYANSPLPYGPVTSILVEEGGIGYTDPVVIIEDVYGKGTGATAEAIVESGVIEEIIITNGGSGYYAPFVVIDDPTGEGAEAVASIGGSLTGGIRKFVDSFAGLNVEGANNLGQYMPIAIPDTTSYPGCDYYEIELGQYKEQLHSDLPPTTLRGYRQTNTSDPNASKFHYMGPLIIARRNVPVRIKFTNKLPTGEGGNLFIPVDTTVMGAGKGPLDIPGQPGVKEMYKQNRATLHLHGGFVPWISDGTPHQWTTPAGENTQYPKGVSVRNVPDMPDPGDGSLTFYYNNQQSARLMFYHDHSYGITRLNVYAGEAAGYLLTDDVEMDMINGSNNTGVNPAFKKVLPDVGIPLIIQDKTFVDANTIDYQDPTWRWGGMVDDEGNWMPMTGDLWVPSVYMPAQNPWDMTGASAFGRWMYGPWFWPPTTNIMHPPIDNPYYGTDPWEPPKIPDMPDPSMGMEAFNDTPLVNGTIYPYMEVEPKAYRFRILNAANDRFFNLQFYVADSERTTVDGRTNTEVKMVPAVKTPGYPSSWPTDGREGGVPDPATRGPAWIQIGNEGGFLPAPVVIPPQPINWNMNPTTFNFGNVTDHSLLLGCAERADVIVDFSAYAGKTLILYNDAPAAFPALDPRYDYYTDNPDQTDSGGTPPTQPGYGPNTRTIMQIRVGTTVTTPTPDVTLGNLKAVFAKTAGKRGVFEVSQDPIIIPQAAYNSAYDAVFPSDSSQFVQIFETSKTFTPIGSTTPVTIPLQSKAIQDEMGEAFDKHYGRMSGFLGLELPETTSNIQNFMLYGYASPPVDVMKLTTDTSMTAIGKANDGTEIWKITHNGVDTHPIHFHLFNVQLINRVAWDGGMMAPDPNELGWKETIRINPLEDTIVAMRPVAPVQPFDLPNSIRLIDPTKPEGALLDSPPPAGFMDPGGVPIVTGGVEGEMLNHYVNFGWEYVWHCHILSHEEMDMMHSLSIAAPPRAPSGLTATLGGPNGNKSVTLNWIDNSANETSFTVQRALDYGFTSEVTTLAVLGENTTTYTDQIGSSKAVYYYRVFATNVVGDTTVFNDPAVDPDAIPFPTKVMNSAYSNVATYTSVPPPAAPTNLNAVLQAGPQVRLSWTDNATNETGFKIERSTNGGDFVPIATVPGATGTGTVTYNDPNVMSGNTYEYRVAAVNAGGPSEYSNTAAVTLPAIPAAPSGLTATASGGPGGNNNRTVTLRWTDNSTNETGFTIQRATNSTFTSGLSTITVNENTTTFSDTKLKKNTTYWYRIRAFSAGGVSDWATPVKVITP